jgi:hypothetical protein
LMVTAWQRRVGNVAILGRNERATTDTPTSSATSDDLVLQTEAAASQMCYHLSSSDADSVTESSLLDLSTEETSLCIKED